MSKERANHIVCSTINTGHGSKDLVELFKLAWNCLPFNCFDGGVDTKVFDDTKEAIHILESEGK